jgi:acyl carrier protein
MIVENAMEGGIVRSLREFILKTYPKARQGVLRVDDRLIEKGIIDSLGLLTLIGFLEQTFGIKVLDSDVTEDKFASIETLSVFVSESLSRKRTEIREKVEACQSSRRDEAQ